MVPVSHAHNFGIYRRQAHRTFGLSVFSQSFNNFFRPVRYQEEFEPIQILSSLKQHFNRMGDQQRSTASAATSVAEGQQREERCNTQGDVAVVQPSFDDHDNRNSGSEIKSETNSEKGPSHRIAHKRNLSEHFQDATTLTNVKASEMGQKHRRGYSGDVSNPPEAHRRIDSTGRSTSVKREKLHRRIDSSGLDALTAAADFSREVLESASGANGRSRHSWNQHPTLRRSPVEASATFEHSGHRPGTSPHPAPTPPHVTAATHNRQYSSLSSSGGIPARPIYYSHPHPSYPQPPYGYGYPPHPGYGRHAPPPPPHQASHYPSQYPRPHGQDTYMKHHAAPLQQPTLERPHIESPSHRASPTVASIDHKQSAASSNIRMGPPAPPHWPRGGTTQGVQTYITGIGVGDTSKIIQPNLAPVHPPAPRSSPTGGHHRKLSSFSNLGPLLFGPPEPSSSGGRHHRSTSSSISFLGALDMNDATFLRNLQESTGTPPAAFKSAKLQEKLEPAKQPSAAQSSAPSKLMAGGTSKRVRRKCTFGGCDNRVVQGGLCIAHGAKRKLCKHPGCKKHVKKAGLCSTHGPARKRCEVEDCAKVAVQGGRCIAHGAKKKLCSIEQCTKQAILSGMCKKHHDQNLVGDQPMVCTIIEPKKNRPSKTSKKPGHTRGLSIFQEISPDAVGDLLTPDTGKQNASKNATSSDTASSAKPPPESHHRSNISQLLVDMV